MRLVPPSLRRWWVIGGALAALVSLGPLLFLARTRIYWVGRTDLEIEYVVTDAATGGPVEGATIQVQSDDGFCDEREKQQFSLVTDAGGGVKRLCKGCMCFGTAGWNVSTYSVHLPWWQYRVSAGGYVPTGWAQLDVPDNAVHVRRGEPAATLVVRVRLEKLRP